MINEQFVYTLSIHFGFNELDNMHVVILFSAEWMIIIIVYACMVSLSLVTVFHLHCMRGGHCHR